MIRMAVPPVPIRSLLLFLQLSKAPIRPVFRAKVLAIDAVFVFVPIVIVLVVAVVDPVMILIVPMVFFLASIVLRLGRRRHCGWNGKGCSEKKELNKYR
jgi:hypothetical protein